MFRSDQIQISRTRWKKGNSGPGIHGPPGPGTNRYDLVRDFPNLAAPGPIRPEDPNFSWSRSGSVQDFLILVGPGPVGSGPWLRARDNLGRPDSGRTLTSLKWMKLNFSHLEAINQCCYFTRKCEKTF